MEDVDDGVEGGVDGGVRKRFDDARLVPGQPRAEPCQGYELILSKKRSGEFFLKSMSGQQKNTTQTLCYHKYDSIV